MGLIMKDIDNFLGAIWYALLIGNSIINRCTSCIARGTPFKIISRALKRSYFISRHLTCRQLQTFLLGYRWPYVFQVVSTFSWPSLSAIVIIFISKLISKKITKAFSITKRWIHHFILDKNQGYDNIVL